MKEDRDVTQPAQLLAKLSPVSAAALLEYEARLNRSKDGSDKVIQVRDVELIRKSLRGLIKRGMAPNEAWSHALTEVGYPARSKLQ
jgi:hypothetical protein